MRISSYLPGIWTTSASLFTWEAWSYLVVKVTQEISVSQMGFEACVYILVQSPCSDEQHEKAFVHPSEGESILRKVG